MYQDKPGIRLYRTKGLVQSLNRRRDYERNIVYRGLGCADDVLRRIRKSKTVPKIPGALPGISLAFALNFMELNTGQYLFNIDAREMLRTGSFNLTFVAIALGASLIYFAERQRNGKGGEQCCGILCAHVFVLTGISLVAAFNTLLILLSGLK